MSDPTAYALSYNFTGYQSANGTTGVPAASLDIQFEDIQQSTEELRDAIMDVRRSDGALANGIVGPDQLSDALVLGFSLQGAWADATAYSAGDGVTYGTAFYKATVAHTSSVSTRPDVDSVTWTFLVDISTISIGDGSITPVKLSADAAGFRTKIGLGDLAVLDETDLADNLHAATAKTALVDDDEFYLLDSEALFARKPVSFADLLASVRAAAGGTPIGSLMDYAGASAPTGWLLCYGQNVSRTTYADLFAVISTTYGVGDGATTFTLPDLRGRVVAGQDDMGGTSANRLTNQSGGIDGDVLGGVGGAETHTLTTAQLAQHTHTASTAAGGSHTHTLTSDGSRHGLNSANPGGNFYTSDGDTNGGFATPSQTTSSNGSHTHTVTVNNAGSGSAHNNVQPTIVLNKIIYAGV